MASSSKSRKIYHVFLSFRGTDVRNNFLSHLYTALELKGIYTYIDSEVLRKGEKIEPALMKAIEESRTAIIVFSEDYASSSWCLDEVAKIMECKEERDLMVFPVFYKVEPKEVRTPREKYRQAMVKHESKHGENSEKLKRWKEALFNASNLSGWHLKEGDDLEHIQRIVKEIAAHLGRTPLDVAKHPVGINSRVAKLKSMFNLKLDDSALMVGLWGQGGIGKTTLAKAIYNDISGQFEGSCFLADVREASKDCKDLVTLQENLLSEILLREQRLVVPCVAAGKNLIQERLCHKKVLLILDDVDDSRQLDALAGEIKWFGNGSLVIFTTRDEHLLIAHRIDQEHVYAIKPLDDSEARKLLSKHAFSTHQTLEIRIDLVDGVLNYAQGLPLALEVLGSFLCGRKEDEWESTLRKLSTSPNKSINDVLKISYDGLEENEKEIFLHIACFFKGRNSEYVKKVLECCDLEPIIGFRVLIERSLIRIRYKIIKMHDLIQLMGIDIVNKECRDDPRRRSRLWLYNDVLDVLQNKKGGCDVKAIVLEPPELKVLSIRPNAFKKMTRLKLLIVHNVHNSFQGPIWLPNELRWIQWAGHGFWNPHFSPGPKKLMRLEMSNCSIAGVVKLNKDFQRLRYIKLSDCESLVSTPDLSFAPNLEELKLWNCKNLIEAHESIAYHDKLQVLHFQWCPELHVFPNVLKTQNLRDLNLSVCSKFERFPDISHELGGLKKLSIVHTAIKELPASIENLVSLEVMYLDICKNPVHIPSNIYKLQKLQLFRSSFRPIVFPKLQDSIDPCMKNGLSNLNRLDLTLCNLSEDSSCCVRLSRGEMPKWFRPIGEGSISFMASKDLYDKFLGLVFCAVCDNEAEEYSLNIQAHFNGKRQGSCYILEMLMRPGGIMLNHCPPSDLWKEVHFGQIDGSYAQFSLTFHGFCLKEWGFRIICKQLEDDLKITLRDNKLIDPAFLYEIGHDIMDSEVESSHMHEANPIEIGLLKNLQESSHMHVNRLVQFDLDCSSGSYDGYSDLVLGEDAVDYPTDLSQNPNRKHYLCLPE
ncbi:hypothetical protein BT93_E1884 [Corymbia citriodora subsp. variegata]|nr:hypothetical protein BT93_E1884 [Corymbia citriodora subsp. variegata]